MRSSQEKEEPEIVLITLLIAIPRTLSSNASKKRKHTPGQFMHLLVCNGQAVSKALHRKLFSVINLTYAFGDTVTTFNVPDLRGSVVLGFDSSQTRVANVLTVGVTWGKAKHTLTVGELSTHFNGRVSLSIQNRGSQSHGVNDPGHNHAFGTGSYWMNRKGGYGNDVGQHLQFIPVVSGVSFGYSRNHGHGLYGLLVIMTNFRLFHHFKLSSTPFTQNENSKYQFKVKW